MAMKESAKINTVNERLLNQVKHLKKQLEEAHADREQLVEGNLAKIKCMHLIRTNAHVVAEEYRG